MFFGNECISVKIQSMLSLHWDIVNSKSGIRPYYALSFRKKGNAEFTYKSKRLSLTSGDIIFVPKDYDYKIKATDEELFVLHFSSQNSLPADIKKFTPKNPEYYERKFGDLYSTWIKKQFGYEYECKSIIYRIISRIEQEIAEVKLDENALKIFDAVEYIHDNFKNRNISVDYLAHMCGMSDTYFRRLFVTHFHITPLKYINNLKIEYATELLRSGYYTVGEVSVKCGFSDINYFSLFYKQQTSVLPSKVLNK